MMKTADGFISELMDFDMVVAHSTNGVTESMLCTLADDVVPESDGKIRNGDNISVFNLETEAWDMIKFSTITSAMPVVYA